MLYRLCTVSLTDSQAEKTAPQLDPFEDLLCVLVYLWAYASRSLLEIVTIRAFVKNGELSCESGAWRNSEFRVRRYKFIKCWEYLMVYNLVRILC